MSVKPRTRGITANQRIVRSVEATEPLVARKGPRYSCPSRVANRDLRAARDRLDRADWLQVDRASAIEASDPVPNHASWVHERVDEPLQHDLERVGDPRDQANGEHDGLGDEPRRRPEQQTGEGSDEDDTDRKHGEEEVPAERER